MHAVIVQVKIDTNREEEMRTILNQEVVPTARQLPGFASGIWLQALEGDRGTAVLIFDSRQAGHAAAERLRATAHGMVELRSAGPAADVPVFTVETVGTYEVVAQALAGKRPSPHPQSACLPRDSSKSWGVFSLAGGQVAAVAGGGSGRCGASLP
jgi:hypothetical protein